MGSRPRLPPPALQPYSGGGGDSAVHVASQPFQRGRLLTPFHRWEKQGQSGARGDLVR